MPDTPITAPPSEYDLTVDMLIDDIDEYIEGKYSFTLRDLLASPAVFAGSPQVLFEIGKLSADIDAFFDARREEMGGDITKYREDAAKATRIYEKTDTLVKEKTLTFKKPLIKPSAFVRREEEDEIFTFEVYDSSLENAVEHLVKNSDMAVDVSVKIDTFTAGRWFFISGNKNRGLYILFPVNPEDMLTFAHMQITTAVDAARTTLERMTGAGRAPAAGAP